MQGFQYDVVVDNIIDEVMEPQLRQVITEAWRDVVEVDRNKQVKKVSSRKTPSHDFSTSPSFLLDMSISQKRCARIRRASVRRHERDVRVYGSGLAFRVYNVLALHAST